MATSDSETFESADEDFEFDHHTSSSASEKRPVNASSPPDTQKSVGETAVYVSNKKVTDSQIDSSAETNTLEANLESLDIARTKLQDTDHSRESASGNRSTSSDSDGDDSVRTLKGENNSKESAEKGAVADVVANKESLNVKESPVTSVVGADDQNVKMDLQIDVEKNKERGPSSARKLERKRPQTGKERKQSSTVKKLGTKITPKITESYKDSLNIETKQQNNEEKFLYSSDHVDTDSFKSDIVSEEKVQKIDSVLEKLSDASEKKASGGWGGWGNWGVSSLLSTATESVSTLTSQVTQGFSSVLETGIGIPDAEELARLDKEREIAPEKKCTDDKGRNNTNAVNEPEKQVEISASDEKAADTHPQDGTGLFGISRVFSGVSTITKLVESTGSKVITGGLDTLETIGKKTMEVLQEGDPGLRKKRELFSDKIILSQILREAKEKAEIEDKLNEDKEAMRKAHFETLFDDYQGLVHLEALEMLSKQCELKMEAILQSLTGQVTVELHDKMDALRELCEIPDGEEHEEEDMSDKWLSTLSESSNDLGVSVCTDKISEVWIDTNCWLNNHKSDVSPQEIHQKAISSLARFTAASVEHFHKTAELLLVKEDRDPFQEAHCLLEMTLLLSAHVNILAATFSDKFSLENDDSQLSSVSDLITNIFFEASNSGSYLKEAFQLVIPVLLLGVKP